MAPRTKAPKIVAPLNYTTKVSAEVTAGECVRLLAKHGASAVGMTFDADQQPTGLSFRIDTDLGERGYRMEVDSTGLGVQLAEASKAGLLTRAMPQSWYLTDEHVHAVAWRQVKDWLEANLAMIAARMWSLDRVMLPWQLVDHETDVYQAIRNQQLALTSGS
jgi:hypothetical protein